MKPKRSLGQNFLTDVHTARTVVREARIDAGTPVVEVGPGRGFLTRYLVETGAPVVVVEKDRELAAALPAALGHPDNLRVVAGDFLEVDLDALGEPPQRLVGNLPYNVSLAILDRALAAGHRWPRLVFMFQWEVAHRLCADPGSKTFGVPTVVTAATHTAAVVRKIPPGAFFPRPKVDSALVRLVPRPEPLVAPDRRAAFADFVGGIFRFRRKTAANALGRAAGVPAAAVAAWLEAAGLPPAVRPEALPVAIFVALFEAFAISPAPRRI